MQAMGDPLMKVKSIWGSRTLRPTLTIYEDFVQVDTPQGLLGNARDRVSFSQIVRVRHRDNGFGDDVVLETRGGGIVTMPSLSQKDAWRALSLIESRVGTHPFGGPIMFV